MRLFSDFVVGGLGGFKIGLFHTDCGFEMAKVLENSIYNLILQTFHVFVGFFLLKGTFAFMSGNKTSTNLKN